MAVDLRCPNCGDNLGKDTENSNPAYCGNCGEEDISNPRGYREEPDAEQRHWEQMATFNERFSY